MEEFTNEELMEHVKAMKAGGWKPGDPPIPLPTAGLTPQQRFKRMKYLISLGLDPAQFSANASATTSSSSQAVVTATKAGTESNASGSRNAEKRRANATISTTKKAATSSSPTSNISSSLQPSLPAPKEQEVAPKMSSSQSSQSDDEPQRPVLPVHHYEHHESCDRYLQNQRDPFYAQVRAQATQGAQTNQASPMQETANQRKVQQEREIVKEMLLEEKMLKPLPFNNNDGAQTAPPRVNTQDLLFFSSMTTENLPRLVKMMQAMLLRAQQEAAQPTFGMILNQNPLGLLAPPNPHLATFSVPSFNMHTFLASNLTIPDRQNALFLQFATPAGQHHFRQLITHNLVSLRSALATAASNVKTYTDQMNDVAGIFGLELVGDYEKAVEVNNAAAAAAAAEAAANEETAPTGEAKIRAKLRSAAANAAPLTPEPDSVPSKSSFAYNFPYKKYTITDPEKSAANKERIQEMFGEMEQKLSDAFFWREVLVLEVRMSEAMLGRLEVAGGCTALLADIFAGKVVVEGLGVGAAGKGKGKAKAEDEEAKEKLRAARERFGMLGEVVRACWGAVAVKLGVELGEEGAGVGEDAEFGWRALRARHAGELWDVVEDERELERWVVEDEKYWDGEDVEEEAEVEMREEVEEDESEWEGDLVVGSGRPL